MENTFTRATKNAAEILHGIKNGGTMFIRTHGHNTKVDKKCVARFEKNGHFLFGDSGEGDFYIAAGRSKNFVFRSYVWINF